MKEKLFALLFLWSVSAYSQHEWDNWCFGLNTAITFSTNPPTYLAGNHPMGTSEGCTSWSDNAGNLLFYSDGTSVWDRTDNIMPNGTGLNASMTCSQAALV